MSIRQLSRLSALSTRQAAVTATSRIVLLHQCRSAGFSKILAESTLATPPEHIRPIAVPQPKITLPPETDFMLQNQVKHVTVEIDGESHSYDTLFLRDLCPCPRCVDTSTRQKLFNTTDIPDTIIPRAIRVKTNNKLEVIWNHPMHHPHVSLYDAELLLRYSTPERVRHFRHPMPKAVYWDGDMMKENTMRTDYEEFLENDQMLHRVLLHLHLYGLAYFVNVPHENTDGTEISNLARRFGEIKQTFYGTTWDVKSVPESKNIAYYPLSCPY